MTGIFISYREADAAGCAAALRDSLVEVLGEDQVYFDKDTQHTGKWREQIQHALDGCKVVALVVVGPRWLAVADEMNRPGTR